MELESSRGTLEEVTDFGTVVGNVFLIGDFYLL